MATAKGAEYDKIQGLDLGADYYLVKPFGVMELVSCVKAVLRRCQPQKASITCCKAGGISLNPDEHIVTANGARVELTYKEYELLRLFLQHPGMAFTRDQLMEKVWGTDYYGETRTIDMHIRTLRQKLGACGEQDRAPCAASATDWRLRNDEKNLPTRSFLSPCARCWQACF